MNVVTLNAKAICMSTRPEALAFRCLEEERSKDTFAEQDCTLACSEGVPEEYTKSLINEGKKKRKFHRYYLQRGGIEFMTPIMFEDGMDYMECEQYYTTLNSQCNGGALHRPHPSCHRCATVEELRSKAQGKPSSCLLPAKHTIATTNATTESTHPRLVSPRRCSFSGIPGFAHSPSRTLERSSSQKRLADVTSHVSFDEQVKVVTIYRANDYPPEVRSKLWMTRGELLHNAKRAWMEQQQQQEPKDAKILTSLPPYSKSVALVSSTDPTLDPILNDNNNNHLKHIKSEPEYAHRKSVDCVVTECIHSHFSELHMHA
jgi:hypothetical protein